MRNLKRALSLTLASVMLLGMMVVGSSAASFPDVDENDNVEAIEVLNAVEVMLGYENGDFGPDDLVTRAQMAVIMAKLLNLDYKYYEASCPFTDVNTSASWARGYVGACYAKGITSGYSATTYGPDDGITPIQAASMMMRALGYFQYAEDYKAGFEVATVSQGTDIGIFEGVGSSATAQMTRDQVARMALNALRSNMVAFTGTPGLEVNGVVVGYRAEYTPRTSPESKYNAITGLTTTILTDNGQYFIQLGEQLYDGKLRLNDVEDAFGRPARSWEYDGKEIGTYVKDEMLRKVWTEKVTGKMLSDLLTKPTVDTYNFTIMVDGESDQPTLGAFYFDKGYLNSGYKSAVGGTGNGVTTEVYVDTATKHVYIAVINTYLAKATGNYDEKREEVSFKVHGITTAPTSTVADPHMVRDTTQDRTLTVSADDFNIADVKKDDIVLVNVANGVIEVMYAPEVMSSVTLSAFSRDSYVVSEGNTINYNKAARYDADVLADFTGTQGVTNLRDKHYNLYLDKNGFIAGLELVENYDNYIFLTGIDTANNDLKNTTAQAAGILTDGTFVNFTMDLDRSKKVDRTGASTPTAFSGGAMQNTWCTYSVDSKDVYTLYEVGVNGGTKKAGQLHNPGAAAATSAIDTKHYTLKGNAGDNYLWNGKTGADYGTTGINTVYGTENSVYMTAKLKTVVTKASMQTVDNNNVAAPGIASTVMEYAGGSKKATIISGVDARSVDIKKTNMTVWAANTIVSKSDVTTPDQDTTSTYYLLPAGVYALYKDNGAVIAAIVIGEDNGVDKHWVVPKNGDIKQERFEASDAKAATDGEWIWGREVFDLTEGKDTVIEERGSTPKAIDPLTDMPFTPGVFTAYEIRTNADGMVTSSKPASESLTAYVTGNKGGYVTDIADLEEAIAETDKDIIIFEDSNLTVQKFDGKTLWVNNAQSMGMLVDPDVTVFFYQMSGGEWTTTVRTGASELGSFLEQLNVDSAGIDYSVTALVKGSRAVSIVLRDNNEETGKINGSGSGSYNPSGNPVSGADASAINRELINNKVARVLTDLSTGTTPIMVGTGMTLYVDGSILSGTTIKLSKGGTVVVGGNVEDVHGTFGSTINGTLKVEGDLNSADPADEIIVTSVDSLHVGGTLKVNVKIGGGTKATNGYAVIGTVAANVKVTNNNVQQETAKIPVIKVAEKDSILVANTGDIKVTGEMNTTKVKTTENGAILLAPKTEIGKTDAGQSVVQAPNGTNMPGDNAGDKGLTIGGPGATNKDNTNSDAPVQSNEDPTNNSGTSTAKKPYEIKSVTINSNRDHPTEAKIVITVTKDAGYTPKAEDKITVKGPQSTPVTVQSDSLSTLFEAASGDTVEIELGMFGSEKVGGSEPSATSVGDYTVSVGEEPDLSTATATYALPTYSVAAPATLKLTAEGVTDWTKVPYGTAVTVSEGEGYRFDVSSAVSATNFSSGTLTVKADIAASGWTVTSAKAAAYLEARTDYATAYQKAGVTATVEGKTINVNVNKATLNTALSTAEKREEIKIMVPNMTDGADFQGNMFFGLRFAAPTSLKDNGLSGTVTVKLNGTSKSWTVYDSTANGVRDDAGKDIASWFGIAAEKAEGEDWGVNTNIVPSDWTIEIHWSSNIVETYTLSIKGV